MGRVVSEERKKGDRLRKEILERDNHKCQICGSKKYLEVHHKKALYQGGKSTEDNLITLCDECHKYAPEDGHQSNMDYLMNRNKHIYEEMITQSDIASTLNVAYMEFLKDKIHEYVLAGIISEEQRDKMLEYEMEKVI